jgi:hypothetical protein
VRRIGNEGKTERWRIRKGHQKDRKEETVGRSREKVGKGRGTD